MYLHGAVGYDGALKMWDQQLQLVAAVKNAHDGARVHCLTIGADKHVYTGGDDKVRQSKQQRVSSFL